MSSCQWLTSVLTRGLALAMLAPATLAVADDFDQKLEQLNVRLRTEHYVLAGTVDDARIQIFGRALEYIHREYARGFEGLLAEDARGEQGSRGQRASRSRGPRAGRAPETDQESGSIADESELFRVIVFKQKQEYDDFCRAFLRGAPEHTIGLYVDRRKLLLILDQGNDDDTFGVLFHEAFHQFIRRYINDPPVWLNEGLASYYGTARATKNGLRFNRPRRDSWKIVRKLATRDQTMPLHEIVHISTQEFRRQDPVNISGWRVRRTSVYYAHAYTFVHMMVNDPDGRKLLQRYIRDLAASNGRNSREITEKHFPAERMDAIHAAWIRYIRSNPENRG